MPKDGPHPTDKHVGSRVRMRRLMLGLSQTQLGQTLGVSFQQLQKYEKGTNRISSSRLAQLSGILQVPIPFFFEGLPPSEKNETPSPTYVSDFLATSHGINLTKAFMQIPSASLRRSIVDLVEAIAGPDDQ
jgi:transcriptional regulator with XRE-family HTH domain